MEAPFSRQRCLAAVLAAALLVPGCPLRTLAAAATAADSPTPTSVSARKSALTSIILVAQGAVSDPNFGGSMVVVMNNLGSAPVGIILNRPTPLSVARFFPQLKRLAHVPDKIYFGGPVEFGTVWYLYRANTATAGAIRVCAGVYVSSDGKLLRELLGRRNPMEGLRIFVGHAGWAPGQLQAEIEGGAWAPKPASAASIFNPEPQLPWPSGRGPRRGT